MSRALISLCLLLCGSAAAADSFYPARRREQYRNDPGWAVVPYIYNLPGIGVGYGVLAAATKVNRTYADVAGTAFAGDANGQAVSVNGLHLLPKRLILDVGAARISRSTLQSFSQRGMGSGKNDYSLIELGTSLIGGSRLTTTFLDRRFEAYAAYYAVSARLNALRDRQGNVIARTTNASVYRFSTQVLGARMDLTDDYVDPRRGFRLEPSLWRTPPQSEGPDFILADVNATAYLPVGRRNTWAFNYLRSDARIIKAGQTDPAALERRTGLDCESLTDPGQQAQCRNYINTLALQNARGMATSLGGFRRLRSYPEERYKGAHSEFLGTEFRWNLTDEVTPFNIYLIKDIRTSVQLAFFYEIGTVAESQGGLWAATRSSYGTGLRVVTSSGLIYRVDLAGGQEGWQPSVFFQYPWEL